MGWAAALLVIAPAVLVMAVGVMEKSLSAAGLLLSGRSLGSWRGDLEHYLPPGFFIGVPGPLGYVAAVLVLAAAAFGVRRLAPVHREAFAAMILGGLLFAVYFRFREFGEYFYFKVLAFLAPVALMAAVAGLANRTGRRGGDRLAIAAAVALVSLQFLGLRHEIAVTGLQLEAETIELRNAVDRLPEEATIRVDVLPDGRQLWASYMLKEHRLSTLAPVRGTTFPYMPPGRKADYIVADSRIQVDPWPDAKGAPLFDNGKFRIYRMRPGIPGPDRSSRRMVDELSPAFE